MQTRPSIPNPFTFLWQNRDTLLLAILLSIAVWVSAVYADDPNNEGPIEGGVELRLIGLPDSIVVLNETELDETVAISIRAPESVWQAIGENPDLIRATVDLSGLAAGEYTLPVEINLQASPAEILDVFPREISVNLDDYITRTDLPLVLNQTGDIAQGFQVDEASMSLDSVTVSGPSTRMSLVTQVIATVSLQDVRQSFSTTVGLFAANEEGQVVAGLELEPKVTDIEVTVSQAGQYRDVAVVVETLGEPAEGYARTSIDVDPLIVTLYAENEKDIEGIPGFVSTEPIRLIGKTESFVIQVPLVLPEGVRQAGEQQTVAVSIGISPKVRNLSISVPITIRNLAEGFTAELSPDNVEVFLTGPEPIINTLELEDLIVFVSLEGYEVGTAFVELQWELLLGEIEVLSINPDTIEVIITVAEEGDLPAETPTPSPTPNATPEATP
jgi:YbbR domain-containing protein